MSSVTVEAGRRLVGRPIVFGARSLDLGGFVEEIAPDALDRTRKDRPDLRALLGHDPALLLGRSSSGTLRYEIDSKGMRVSIDPPNTATGNETVELVRRRDIDGMSFAFLNLVDDWRMEGNTVVRIVRDMTLREVSVVSWPAYPSTSVSVDGQRSAGAGGYERWNDPGSRQTVGPLIEKARRLASGTVRCELCPKLHRSAGIATAIRHGAPLCPRCLSEGDELRQRSFRGETGTGGKSVSYNKARLQQSLIRDRKYYDTRLKLAR